jgi:hypothetical protein
MRGAGVALLLLLSSAAGAGESPAEEARAAYELGMKHYNLGAFADALAAFKQGYLAKADPTFLFNIGQCQRMLGNAKDEIYAYRRYLSEVPDAPNRVEVEKFIADAEEELHRRAAAEPPTGTLPIPAPVPAEPPPAPQPVVAATPAPVTPPITESTPFYRKPLLWILVGVAVVAAVGIGVGVALGSAKDAPIPSSTAGKYVLSF